MGHGAHGTLVAGELGTLRVDVSRLNNTHKGDQQSTQQRQNFQMRLMAPCVWWHFQTEDPVPGLINGYTTLRRAMHRLVTPLVTDLSQTFQSGSFGRF